ncbi:unnamed protein product [Didymodactylos carnosus]|nr:unnamed protein product [Didymodactylos carnosus]CAF4181995.1 unnamed protein product [Didymodactylos carnosus]
MEPRGIVYFGVWIKQTSKDEHFRKAAALRKNTQQERVARLNEATFADRNLMDIFASSNTPAAVPTTARIEQSRPTTAFNKNTQKPVVQDPFLQTNRMDDIDAKYFSTKSTKVSQLNCSNASKPFQESQSTRLLFTSTPTMSLALPTTTIDLNLSKPTVEQQ